MVEIDNLVKEAHSKKYRANCLERKAITMVEQEIEKWNN
jgi:DnaJ-domain-containing protein 1